MCGNKKGMYVVYVVQLSFSQQKLVGSSLLVIVHAVFVLVAVIDLAALVVEHILVAPAKVVIAFHQLMMMYPQKDH